jgi:hypothetical protein
VSRLPLRPSSPVFGRELDLPTCGGCRFFEARTGDRDACGFDDEPVTHSDPACEQFVTVRAAP